MSMSMSLTDLQPARTFHVNRYDLVPSDVGDMAAILNSNAQQEVFCPYACSVTHMLFYTSSCHPAAKIGLKTRHGITSVPASKAAQTSELSLSPAK